MQEDAAWTGKVETNASAGQQTVVGGGLETLQQRATL